ncbi:hypothetical protein [Ensifer aridi]|uniref:hypothetical protein n=1 Tax=Ensifer aridi TaxID=1708715 RepID=UPI0009BCF419|nr:hypothetical protein [Ensifer aridi]
MSSPFVNPLARGTPGVVNSVRVIKQWTREVLKLDDDAIVCVNELACHLPGCPPKETVVLVMQGSGSTMQASLHKPMKDIVIEDIASAFRGGG